MAWRSRACRHWHALQKKVRSLVGFFRLIRAFDQAANTLGFTFRRNLYIPPLRGALDADGSLSRRKVRFSHDGEESVVHRRRGVTLALGIGVNCAAFSIANGTWWKKLPFKNPKEVVTLGVWNGQGAENSALLSYPEFVEVRSRVQSLKNIAAVEEKAIVLTTAIVIGFVDPQDPLIFLSTFLVLALVTTAAVLIPHGELHSSTLATLFGRSKNLKVESQ